MADPKSESSPEHIEELLSQLKGIFGHLSESEQEEAKRKITPPAASIPTSPAPVESVEPALDKPEPANVNSPAPELDPFPSVSAPEASNIPLEPWVPAATDAAPTPTSDYAPNEVIIPPGASLVPTAILYPAGRIAEAKILTEKVERITPKFTKVAVVINVQGLVAYDAKSDLKTLLPSQVDIAQIKAVFVLVEKGLDDARRKGVASELESHGVYFHEIAINQLEKKAVYTDMLLGMVFFFDSRKPAGEAPAA